MTKNRATVRSAVNHNFMTNQYITIKQGGNLYPKRLITRNDEAGKFRVEGYRLSEGEEFVIIELVEIKPYEK